MRWNCRARRKAHPNSARCRVTDAEKQPRRARCPVCGRAPAPDQRPFCSDRCRQVDLGRWMTEAYAIPATVTPEETED
ncbi:MAG: DNA gyrase inhibitor YacG [Roseomonas sp.]|nr:DNA gyrase inhibitor YacG [Roseomonas sp.]MCA3299560.1 DNA gyrase inhibitor YacG [Roseomonas sp.]